MLGQQTLFRLKNPGKTKLAAIEEEDFGSQQLFRKLSPDIAAKLSAPPPTQDWPEGRRPQHFIVECWANGDCPVLRVFRNEEAMLMRMRDLVNQDVNAFSAWGVPIPFSKDVPGDSRIVFLPNDTARKLDAKLTVIDELDAAVNIQDDNYMGPPELMIVSPRTETEAKPAKKPRKKNPEVDPDGEGDEFSES